MQEADDLLGLADEGRLALEAVKEEVDVVRLRAEEDVDDGPAADGDVRPGEVLESREVCVELFNANGVGRGEGVVGAREN